MGTPQRKVRTVLDLDVPLTDEERREFHELDLAEYPRGMTAKLTPVQRRRVRELLRRQREPIPVATVLAIAAEERAKKTHGYLKRTSARLNISARRVSQIIKDPASKRTRK